jgi:di/tricarboxylate transporter
MLALVKKGGYKSYALLLVVVMFGASFPGAGATGYYVLILSLISTIPYNKKMPTSKLMMPLGFATNHPLLPFNVALFYGVAVSVLETAGYTAGLSMSKFAVVNFILALGFLAWSLVAYRLLPDHPISEASEYDEVAAAIEVMPVWKEYCTIAAFILSVVGMMLMSVLGNAAYVIPGLAGAFLLIINVLDFREVRDNMGAPVILMMAGVIGVADALANSGFTAMIGEVVADSLGTNINPFILIFMGSVFIFAPIAIATSISLGLNPVAAATAVVIAGWNGGYMPVDGMPAMILGMGKYKLPQFWLFAVPMYLIRIFALCIGAIIMFPVS